MYCPRCGAENADNRTLCLRCRKPLAIRLVGGAALPTLKRRLAGLVAARLTARQPLARGNPPQQDHQHREGQ
jgi:hypothetical protein